MSRSLLATKKLPEFIAYCSKIGVETREGKGDYQALQVKLKSGSWMPIYERSGDNFHLTVPSCLHGLVWSFIKQSRAGD